MWLLMLKILGPNVQTSNLWVSHMLRFLFLGPILLLLVDHSLHYTS